MKQKIIFMPQFSEKIKEEHKTFIERQHLFFVSTSPLYKEGHINLSPKGQESFKVLSPNRVAYMDFIGSGNETSAHLLQNGRITFMFCAFEGPPNISRLYGKGYTVLPGDTEWELLAEHFTIYRGTRQLIVADIHKVQTSCGFGVPLYEFIGERDFLFKWAATKNDEELEQYKQEKNLESIDGLPAALKKSVAQV